MRVQEDKTTQAFRLNQSAIRRQHAPEGECKYCDEMREKGENFFPRHDASRNCESGKHPHCTCDTCF